jgi:hypothetical protein
MLHQNIAYTVTSGTSPLGRLAIAALMAGIAIYYAIGTFMLPFWILPLLPIAFFGGYYITRHASAAILVLTLTLTLVQLKPEKGVFSIYDAVAGSVICLLLIGIICKRIMSYEQYAINSKEYLLFVVYFLCIAILGSTNLIFSELLFVPWFKEVLLLSPLLIIPSLFLQMDLTRKRDKYIFYGTMITLAILCFVVSVVKVRSSFLAANYLFEASYGGVNLINGPCMLFLFFQLFLSETGKKKYLYVFGVVISIATIALAHNRTMIVLAPIILVASVAFLPRNDRKKGIKLLFGIGLAFLIVVGALYLSQPFVRLVIDYFFLHVLSSSKLSSDASLIGRYVEWRHIWQAIERSPVIGYGVGGTYHTYNWFGGFSLDMSYTHNGYLGILHKGGIIGFLMLALAYGGFIRKGIMLLRKKLLTGLERAIVRAGLSALILLVFATNTFNMFAHRDVLMYVGLIWGYFLYIERHAKVKLENRNIV